MQKKNVVYMNKIDYKLCYHRRLIDIYTDDIYNRIDAIIEGAFARGYNACLDDVSIYLPKGMLGKRPKDGKI